MASRQDSGEVKDLTIEEFIALLKYVNKKLEELYREGAKFQRYSAQISRMTGPEDIMKILLQSTLQTATQARTAPQQYSEASEEDLEELKVIAKRKAQQLLKAQGETQSEVQKQGS